MTCRYCKEKRVVVSRCLLGLLLSFVVFPVYGGFLSCPDGNGIVKKLNLEMKYSLNEELLKESKARLTKLGVELDRICLSGKEKNISIEGNVYYSKSRVALQTEKNTTWKKGLEAKLNFKKWKNKSRVTPYISLKLEKQDVEVVNITGKTRSDVSDIFVWGIGIEWEIIEDKVALEISRSYSFDNLNEEKLFDENAVEFIFNLGNIFNWLMKDPQKDCVKECKAKLEAKGSAL